MFTGWLLHLVRVAFEWAVLGALVVAVAVMGIAALFMRALPGSDE